MSQRNAWVRALGALTVTALAVASVQAQAPTPAPIPAPASATERLTHVVKLWGQIRYLHPWLAYKDLDWDAAFVQAVPKVRAATTAEQYAAAVQGMLDALGDPATGCARQNPNRSRRRVSRRRPSSGSRTECSPSTCGPTRSAATWR
jgi:hypothetical protein